MYRREDPLLLLVEAAVNGTNGGVFQDKDGPVSFQLIFCPHLCLYPAPNWLFDNINGSMQYAVCLHCEKVRNV